MSQLLPPAELPADFGYPGKFLRVVDQGLVDLEPWMILQAEDLLVRHHGRGIDFGEPAGAEPAHIAEIVRLACEPLQDLSRDGEQDG